MIIDLVMQYTQRCGIGVWFMRLSYLVGGKVEFLETPPPKQCKFKSLLIVLDIMKYHLLQ